jgi:alkylation response protein AidB-like acyl-CoA dehydrogenase
VVRRSGLWLLDDRRAAAARGGAPIVAGGPLYLISNMIVFAASFAAISLGLARASMDAFVRLAREKHLKGAAVSLRESPVVQLQFATAEARLRAARAHLRAALSDAWQEARETGAISLDRRVAQRIAATFAIREGADVVDVVYNAAGASAIFENNPFERRFRDVHAVTQQVQAQLSHLENAGKYLLGAEFAAPTSN